MNLVSRLLFCAALLAGLAASAVAGGPGCDGKGSACRATCPTGGAPQSACGHAGSPCQKANACATNACENACQKGDCPGCPADCCDEECCDEYGCCTDGCPCDDECRARCGEKRNCAEFCGENGCDDENCNESCCSETADKDDSGCCGDIWFFGNWLKSWNGHRAKAQAATKSPQNFKGKNFSPGMKCEKFQAAFPLAKLYGRAMHGPPNGKNASAGCYSPFGVIQFGVSQAGAANCACGCNCENCTCGKANTACQAGATCPAGTVYCPQRNMAAPPGACPFGFSTGHGVTGPHVGRHGPQFIAAPLAPPPCPAMGPHAGLFEKMAHVMAENAALKAKLEAKEQFKGEQDCLRTALTEARQELARVNSSQQTGGHRDQFLIEWMKTQAESSARKDEMLVELLGAVVELQGNHADESCCEKFEAKFEQMEAALKQAQEDNARLRNEVSHLRRERTRVSTPAEPTSYPGRGASRQSTDAYKVQTPAETQRSCPPECTRY